MLEFFVMGDNYEIKVHIKCAVAVIHTCLSERLCWKHAKLIIIWYVKLLQIVGMSRAVAV